MWVTLDCPNVTEAAVTLGIDWIVIEMEHGHLAWGDVINHLRVTSGTPTASLVRVAQSTRENVQRALDLGAQGIILPMMSDQQDVEQAFQFGRYPPRGVRGVGGERCVAWGLEAQAYLAQANDETMLIPLLETRSAAENVDSILNVAGLEAIFFGPADMSASYGHLGQWEGGDVAEIMLRMRREAAARGIAAGILGRDLEEVAQRRRDGFQMIGLGADMNLMIRSLQTSLEAARRPQVVDGAPDPHP